MKAYTDDEIKKAVLESLHFVAPEVDLSTLKEDTSFREQIDIDSLDFVRFVIRLHGILEIEIPEVDYPQLGSVDSCIQYIKTKRFTKGLVELG